MKRLIRKSLLGLICWAAACCAFARGPVAFDQATWKSLLSASENTLVVFTSIHCVHCPGLVVDLLNERASSSARHRIVIVTTDGGSQDLQRAPYASADARYFFRGNAQALRYSVEPSWRGVTPYVALLKSGATPKFHAGRPSPDEIRRWSEASP